MKIHPHERSLAALLDKLAENERRALRHVLDCAGCRDRVTVLLERAGVPAGRVLPWRGPGYRALLERVLARAVEAGIPLQREQAEAPVLLGELLLLPAEARRRRVALDPRFATWSLADLLLDRSRERSFDDAAEAEGMARLALAVIDRLERRTDEAAVSPALVADLRARGQAFVANALRIRGELGAAAILMAEAERTLAAGTRDPVERARLLELQGSLAKDRSRHRDAARLLRKAIALYRATAETHRAGRAMLKLATVHRGAGSPRRALAALGEAVELLDGAHEPRLLLCARHNLAEYLTALGRPVEAWRIFQDAQALYDRFPDPWAQRRRTWLEGKLHLALDRPELAEERLEAARQGFLAQELEADAALVCADVAALYARQGRREDLARLAGEMAPVLAAPKVPAEVRAALARLRDQVREDRASPAFVADLTAYLWRARHDPGLRFEARSA